MDLSIILATTTVLSVIVVIMIIILWLSYRKSQHDIALNSSARDKPSVIRYGSRATVRPFVDTCINLKRLHNKADLEGSEYQNVEKRFKEQWTKRTVEYPEPPTLVAIYAIQNIDLGRRYDQYKEQTFGNSSQEPNEEWHFHGTSMECDILSSNKCCSTETCGVCGISRNGFDLSSVRNRFQRFGKGIYFAPNSSKSNDYTASNQSGYRAQLLCHVACGKKHILYNDDTSLSAPPVNYHSVYGKASTDGKLNYDELVVYDADAVNPRFIIIYRNPVESNAISAVQEVTINKHLLSHAMADEENVQSYSYARLSHSQQHNVIMGLNDGSLSRSISSYKSSNVAYGVQQTSRNQYMHDQYWSRNAPSFGGATSYATVFLEDRDKLHKRENQYYKDQSRSSPSTRDVSGYTTLAKETKEVNKSKNHYMHDQSRSSPSIGGISRHAIPLAEHRIGGSKQKSHNDQSRSSPTYGRKHGCSTTKQKNNNQSWSSYLVEKMSSMYNSLWSEPPTEDQLENQCDLSWSSTSIAPSLEHAVIDGKHKRESHYDRTRGPSTRFYGHTAASSEYAMSRGKQRSKSQSRSVHDQCRSSPSDGGTSSYATPSAEHDIRSGGSKQKSKSQTHQSGGSPSSGGKSGTTSHFERKTKMNKDSSDQSWSSYIVKGISSILPWSEPTERNQYNHFRSSPSVNVAPSLKRDCQQKRDSHNDQSRSSSVRKSHGHAPPSSKRTVGVGKQTWRKSQIEHDQARSSFVGGTRYATPFSADRKGGDHGGKYSSMHKRHYDQFRSSPGTEGIPRFVTETPSLNYKGNGAKHQSKSPSDPASRRLPSSGVKSSHGATGQSTSKVARTPTGQTMQFKRKR